MTKFRKNQLVFSPWGIALIKGIDKNCTNECYLILPYYQPKNKKNEIYKIHASDLSACSAKDKRRMKKFLDIRDFEMWIKKNK